MRGLFNNRTKIFIALIALFAMGVFQFAVIVSANNTPQTLPFSQNWSNAGLITVDDNWSNVPGIVGYRGDDIVTALDTDLRTILADGSTTPIDVNANRNDPDVFTTGGIVEFDGIPNPTIALQGSGTADVPHIVIYLNTTGQSNIQLTYNARDIDAGSDVVQQLNTQYRVGGTGNYINLTGGYIADASAAGATLVTPVSVTLPAAANNQSLVEIRILTTNATGSDEFIGIDDISVTGTTSGGGTPTPTPTPDAPVDINGDGKTDYVVIRSVVGIGGSPANQARWFYNINGSNAATAAIDWGLADEDIFVMEDFDGDGKDDFTAWRPGAPGVAAFYILNSAGNTVRVERFGQTGDDPSVVGDYNGDGRADLAVYREGTAPGAQSTWFYRTAPNGPVTFVPWGLAGDVPAPGDYDGDGRNDFVIQRPGSGGQGAVFWTKLATGAVSNVQPFGFASDDVVPGDYDGDGKTDLAVVRYTGGTIQWFWKRSSDAAVVGPVTFGVSATDFTVQGDYDGDGRTDLAIWRDNGQFIWRSSSNGTVNYFGLGSFNDYPVANYNTHFLSN